MNIAELISHLKNVNVLVVGDLILDSFLWGTVSRISPEAPVPVVSVDREEFYPGGAANVARNLAPFCGKVSAMGRLGNDQPAERLKSTLEENGIDLAPSLVSANIRTSCKTRVVARQQQVVRFDREEIKPLHQDEMVAFFEKFRAVIEDYGLVIIQDYAKGLIDQRMLDEITETCRQKNVLVVGDPNPRNPLIWRRLDAVKPNRSEAFGLAGESDHQPGKDPKEDDALSRISRRLLEEWGIPRLLVTLGDQGMIHYNEDGEVIHVPTSAQQVFDVSGAGDTAIGIYAASLAAGLSDWESVSLANAASGIVVAKLGTAFVTPDELSQFAFED